MFKKFVPTVLSVIILSFSVFAQGSLPDIGIRSNLALGVVKIVGEKKIVIETKDGMLDVLLLKATAFKRLPPDNLKLSAATESSLSDLGIGDRVLVTGKVSDDKKNIFTKTVYLVKGSDIVAKAREQRREWTRRGITGRVTKVNAETKEISAEIPNMRGAPTKVTITPKEDVKYLRYAQTSVKYSDATPSDFSTITKGDVISALGDKSEDGLSLKAEQILTGAFVTVVGKVKSVDVEKNEVTVTDLKTKKDVTISVKETSLMKKFPEQFAQRLAQSQAGQGRGRGVQPPNRNRNNQGNRPAGRNSEGQGGDSARQGRRGQGRPGGGGRGRRGGFDINRMIERFPTITVSDLKTGDMIAASSPKGNDPQRLTAIKLLAGVEPFVTMAQFMASRNSGGRGGRGRNSGSLRIPGLDDVEF